METAPAKTHIPSTACKYTGYESEQELTIRGNIFLNINVGNERLLLHFYICRHFSDASESVDDFFYSKNATGNRPERHRMQ